MHTGDWTLVCEVSEQGISFTAVQGAAIKHVEHTAAPGKDQLTLALVNAARRVVDKMGTAASRSVVVIDGLLDANSGTLKRSLPAGRWRDEVVVAQLEELTGVPAVLLRRGEAGAIGERLAGAATDHTDFLYMLLCSTDVHAGLFVDGQLSRLIRGSLGQAVVDIDTPRTSAAGVRGALAAFASLDGMLRTRRDFLAAARDVNESATCLLSDDAGAAALDDGVGRLARALDGARSGALIAGIFSIPIETVIIGTYDAQLQEVVADRLTSHLHALDDDRDASTWNVIGSVLGDRAPLWGAALFTADA